MTLPTIVKTWQVSKNNTVAAQGSALNTEKRVFRTIKNLMSGSASAPWLVRSSCNGAGSFGNQDGIDRIVTDADIVKNTAGSNHSWIVLRQTGIATNYEVCLDFNSASQSVGSIIVSPSASFVSGTATARPTAGDEIVLINTTTWCANVDAQHQINYWQSTDGEAARIMVWRGTTNMPMFWLFEKPRNVRSGWVSASVSMTLANTTTICNALATIYTTYAGSFLKARGKGGNSMILAMTGESVSAGLLANTSPTSAQTNDFDGAWDFYPIGLASDSTFTKGRHGMLNDLWWGLANVSDADTFPSSSVDKQFVKAGGLILPWDPGGSTTMLLT